MEFNETKKTSSGGETRNYEGGLAFEPQSAEMHLYKLTVNNLLEDTYYREDKEAFTEVLEAFDACAEENPEFVLKLAAYARQVMYLRDISQLLLTLSGMTEETQPYVRAYAGQIIDRADEPAEVLAMWEYLEEYTEGPASNTLPKPLKKALGDAMNSFDEYELAKYDSDRREKNLKDVLNMARPEPKDQQQNDLFRRLAYGELDETSYDPEKHTGAGEVVWKDHWDTGASVSVSLITGLKTPETWETEISERGNTAEAWRDVLPRMPLFARIRNLRNMLEAGIPGVEIVQTRLEDSDGEVIAEPGMSLDYVRNSKIFPFRFYQAYKALKRERVGDDQIERWLSEAIDASAENVPDDLGNSLVVADTSGSMRSSLSQHSSMTYKEISTLFAAVLSQKGAIAGAFADDFEIVEHHVDTPTLEIARTLQDAPVGGATNGWKVPKYLCENDEQVDRIIMLTDMQIWDNRRGYGREKSLKEEFDRYRAEVSPETTLYMMDLASYGDLQTPEGYEGVYNISGWSEQVLDFIEYAEKPGQVIEEIEAFGV